MYRRETMTETQVDRTNLIGKLGQRATLRQLQMFEAVARNGSFTAAAEELLVAQPTVSMQLKKLADTVGMVLFEQVGNRVRLTEAGREVDAACEEVFGAIASLETRIADLQGIRRGTLRLAVISSAKYIGPHLLGRFGQRYPGVEFTLAVNNRESLIQRIIDQHDDLFILGRPPPELDVEALPLLPNPLVVVAPRDHPLVGVPRIPLERLQKEAFIMREPGSGTRDALLQHFESRGVPPPRTRLELSSTEAMKQATAAGLGLSVMSLHALTLEGTDGPLAVLDVQGFPLRRHWFLAYPRSRRLTLLAQTFLDFVGEQAHEIAEEYDREISKIRGLRRAGPRENPEVKVT